LPFGGDESDQTTDLLTASKALSTPTVTHPCTGVGDAVQYAKQLLTLKLAGVSLKNL